MRIPEELVVKLAAYLALVGAPTDQQAQDVFWSIRGLFISQARVHQWERTLALIPATPEAMLKISACYRLFAGVAGTRKWESAKFDLAQVVGVMLEVSDPAAYIKNAERTDFLEPRSLFHPNTLKATTERLRGAFGILSRDRAEHTEQIRTSIRVIGSEDD